MWYNYYHDGLWGMNWIWWIVWLLFLFWIFAIPYRIPGQRYHRNSALDILNRRLANGEISRQEYDETKAIMHRK